MLPKPNQKLYILLIHDCKHISAQVFLHRAEREARREELRLTPRASVYCVDLDRDALTATACIASPAAEPQSYPLDLDLLIIDDPFYGQEAGIPGPALDRIDSMHPPAGCRQDVSGPAAPATNGDADHDPLTGR